MASKYEVSETPRSQGSASLGAGSPSSSRRGSLAVAGINLLDGNNGIARHRRRSSQGINKLIKVPNQLQTLFGRVENEKKVARQSFARVPLLLFFRDRTVETEFIKWYYPNDGLQFKVVLLSGFASSLPYIAFDAIRCIWDVQNCVATMGIRVAGHILAGSAMLLVLLPVPLRVREAFTIVSGAWFSLYLSFIGPVYSQSRPEILAGLHSQYENGSALLSSMIVPSLIRTRYVLQLFSVLIPTLVGCIVAYIAFPISWYQWPDILAYMIFLTVIMTFNFITSYAREKNARNTFVKIKKLEQDRAILEAETKRTTMILNNIFPSVVVERMQRLNSITSMSAGADAPADAVVASPRTRLLAEKFDLATYLFSDFAGFTSMSSTMPAEQLVKLINTIFLQFDVEVQRKQCTKIKTIGDAYIITANAPVPAEDHAQRIVDLALALQEQLKILNEENRWSMKMRIGINTGPAVCAVLGQHKKSYEILGEAQAIAHFCESTGEHGTAHITQKTKDRLENVEQKYSITPTSIICPDGQQSYLVRRSNSAPIDIATDEDVSSQGTDPLLSVRSDKEENLVPIKPSFGKRLAHQLKLVQYILAPASAPSTVDASALDDDLKLGKNGKFTHKTTEKKFWNDLSKRHGAPLYVLFFGSLLFLLFLACCFVTIGIRADKISSLFYDWRMIILYVLFGIWGMQSLLVAMLSKFLVRTPRGATVLKLLLMTFAPISWLAAVAASALPFSKAPVPATTFVLFLQVFFTRYTILPVTMRQVNMILIGVIFIATRLISTLPFQAIFNIYNIVEPMLLALNFTGPMIFDEKQSRDIFIVNEQITRNLQRCETQRAEGERMLLNCIPEPIVARLKQDPSSIFDSIANASVVFIELIQFEHLINSNSDEIVEVIPLLDKLDAILHQMDDLAVQFKCEKIKIVGSIFIAVAGCPVQDDRHALNACSFAVAALQLVSKQPAIKLSPYAPEHKIQARVGVNSGSIVAAVLGFLKFAYDIVGDAVNTASRMCSTADPMTVQVSQSTHTAIKDDQKFANAKQRQVAAKGKGTIPAYVYSVTNTTPY